MSETINKAPRGRPQRRKVGVRNRLEIINKDPNRVYRLIDSDAARLWQFDQAGWRREDVAKHLPGQTQRVDLTPPVENSIPVGGGAKQVLVSIEREFYEEDQKAKEAEIREQEKALKPNSDGFYGGIKIQN